MFHIVRIVWILDGVNPLVSLSHRLYDQVRLVAVEFDPGVCRHSAVVHQGYIVPPICRVVLERHLELDGGQRDVEILPEEQSDLFIICTREWQKDDSGSESIIDRRYLNYGQKGKCVVHLTFDWG